MLYTYNVLDNEYDMLQMIVEDLRAKGKNHAADDIVNAQENLYKAILDVKKSWKFLEDDSICEQIKMNI